MAEFCLDCFNKHIMIGDGQIGEKDVILSDDWCEGCQEWKPCVVVLKPKTFRGRLKRTYNITKYNWQCFIQDLKEKYIIKSHH